MLFDLLSTDMYCSYNVKLAHIIGLKASIYVSELININRKALNKNKLIGDFFEIDRKYIEQRTTLKEQEQKDIDKALTDIDLIARGDQDNHLKVNMDTLTGLLLEKNKSIIDKATNIVKRGRPSKQDIIIRALKSNIKTNNNELILAYEGWIDSVIARQGWMSKESVIEGQLLIDKFTSKDLDIALSIIKIASINGFRDMQWAINEYKKTHRNKAPSTIISSKVSSEDIF